MTLQLSPSFEFELPCLNKDKFEFICHSLNSLTSEKNSEFKEKVSKSKNYWGSYILFQKHHTIIIMIHNLECPNLEKNANVATTRFTF